MIWKEFYYVKCRLQVPKKLQTTPFRIKFTMGQIHGGDNEVKGPPLPKKTTPPTIIPRIVQGGSLDVDNITVALH